MASVDCASAIFRIVATLAIQRATIIETNVQASVASTPLLLPEWNVQFCLWNACLRARLLTIDCSIAVIFRAGFRLPSSSLALMRRP